MFKIKPSDRWLLVVLSVGVASLLALNTVSAVGVGYQTDAASLEKELRSQYATIERVIADPPPLAASASVEEWRVELRRWQDDLASQFGKAADLVQEIIKTNPPQPEMWRERLETLRLYAQPISSPESRTIYGDGEVDKRARVLSAPAAARTSEALAAKVTGDVRLRMVLASDGSVKYIFPIKSQGHGTTEAAIEAARQIKFEPAVRNGRLVSQFVTFVYEFRKGLSSKPYIPRTVF
ncbi:MAG TPA: TonB family protein [Pyrinomonadaceae bacterium]